MSVTFVPDTWNKSSQAISDEAQAFGQQAAQTLNTMTAQSLGCQGNGTRLDAAIAAILPGAVAAFHETALGLGKGFIAIGQGMAWMGENYAQIEAANADQASQVGS